MAFGPYQHAGFAYQGTGSTAYQIGVIGSGILLAVSADITGSGTVTGGGTGPASYPKHIHLDWSGILHKDS